MCAPKAPTPPNVKETASAQTQTSIATAIANALIGQTNQRTPYGSVNYNQTGSFDFVDPSSGQSMSLPRFTQETTLSPEQQALFDTQNRSSQAIAGLAERQAGRLGGVLDQQIAPAQYRNPFGPPPGTSYRPPSFMAAAGPRTPPRTVRG